MFLLKRNYFSLLALLTSAFAATLSAGCGFASALGGAVLRSGFRSGFGGGAAGGFTAFYRGPSGASAWCGRRLCCFHFFAVLSNSLLLNHGQEVSDNPVDQQPRGCIVQYEKQEDRHSVGHHLHAALVGTGGGGLHKLTRQEHGTGK